MSEVGRTWGDAACDWSATVCYIAIFGIFCWTYLQSDGCTAGELGRAKIAKIKAEVNATKIDSRMNER